MENTAQIRALASRLLKDRPLFDAAFSAMKQQSLDAIVASRSDETALREQHYYRIRAVEELAAELEHIAQEV